MQSSCNPNKLGIFWGQIIQICTSLTEIHSQEENLLGSRIVVCSVLGYILSTWSYEWHIVEVLEVFTE